MLDYWVNRLMRSSTHINSWKLTALVSIFKKNKKSACMQYRAPKVHRKCTCTPFSTFWMWNVHVLNVWVFWSDPPSTILCAEVKLLPFLSFLQTHLPGGGRRHFGWKCTHWVFCSMNHHKMFCLNPRSATPRDLWFTVYTPHPQMLQMSPGIFQNYSNMI